MDNIFLPQKSTILKITRQTDIEWLFKVQSDLPVACGQFLQISLPKVGEMPISVAGFNLEEGWIEFLIRKVGRVTNVVFDLHEGDSLFLRGPYGNYFPLDHFHDKELIIVAGGSGTAPVRPLIKRRIMEAPEKTTLIAGFKDPSSILFKEDFSQWQTSKAGVVVTVDKLDPPMEGLQKGLVTKHIPEAIQNKDKGTLQAVIVGPPVMMKFAVEAFLGEGLSEDQIWVSYERNMSCGVGKCGHCKIDDVYICLEGPVFNFAQAKLLVD